MAMSEWSGIATTNTLDAAASDNGSGNPASAGVITTTNARDLLFATTAYAPTTFGIPTPGTWTEMTGISNVAITQDAWYRTESVAGTFALQVPRSGGRWDAAVAALRIAL